MAEVLKNSKPVKVEWSKETSLKAGKDSISSVANICRFLARSAPDLGLYGSNIIEQTEVSQQRNCIISLKTLYAVQPKNGPGCRRRRRQPGQFFS